MQTIITPPQPEEDVFYPHEVQMPQGEDHYDICRKFADFLEVLFADALQVHAGGDIFFYYETGNPKKSVAPDAYIIRGIDKRRRKIFKLWEEPLDVRFVLEVWSETNSEIERRQKFALYQSVFKAAECVELDIETGRLSMYRLNADGLYEEVVPTASGRFFSEELGAELVYEDGLLRLYKSGQRIPTLQEALKLSQIK